MMVTKNVLKTSKVWFRFTKTLKNCEIMKFRWEQLPEHRIEEFIDFNMNYFVKHEITHVVAGIHRSPKAMEEYRHIIARLFKKPSHHNAICCVDDDTNEIVAFNSLKLYKRGEDYTDIEPAQTDEVKKFYQILHDWNNLCPVPDVLVKYGVNKFMDGAGCAVHPKYRGYGISNYVPSLRQIMCKSNGVPLTGAWLTSVPTQKSFERDDWETLFEISSEKLEKLIKITFHNPPPMFVYKVKKVVL